MDLSVISLQDHWMILGGYLLGKPRSSSDFPVKSLLREQQVCNANLEAIMNQWQDFITAKTLYRPAPPSYDVHILLILLLNDIEPTSRSASQTGLKPQFFSPNIHPHLHLGTRRSFGEIFSSATNESLLGFRLVWQQSMVTTHSTKFAMRTLQHPFPALFTMLGTDEIPSITGSSVLSDTTITIPYNWSTYYEHKTFSVESSAAALTSKLTNNKRARLWLHLSMPNIQARRGHKSSELPFSKLSLFRCSRTYEAQIQGLMMKVSKGQFDSLRCSPTQLKVFFQGGMRDITLATNFWHAVLWCKSRSQWYVI